MKNNPLKTWIVSLAVIGTAAFGWTAKGASVGPTGYTNAFALQPSAADWSTYSLAGGNTTYGTATDLDNATTTLSASTVNLTTVADASLPASGLGNANANATWNSAGLYLQTRPTGDGATVLMCTLINDIGGAASGVTINYDFARIADGSNGTEPREEIDGLRAYYSLSGAAGSWTPIGAFSTGSSGRLTTTLTVAWPGGSPLYLLWIDDNAVASSPDPAMQIDNFFAKAIPAAQTPAQIVTSPQSITVGEAAPASFTVTASGNPPPTFQWYKDNLPLTDATNATYSIASTPLSYNGSLFQVIAANTASNVNYMATSFAAVLTVNADTNGPIVVRLTPPAGSVVAELTSIDVLFNEPVDGVDAGDLLINGQPATSITFGVPGQVAFQFSQPLTGLVTLAWANNNGIVDRAATPNAFAGGSWNYTLDPVGAADKFIINEFLASNDKGLRDENGDDPDWIEIYNTGQAAGNLQGWYLTDDPFNLTKWQFPYRVMDPGTYLVVFASGKNRTNLVQGTIFTNLHTSFSLSAGGSYLALVSPSTNVVSQFAPTYPPQTVNVSYGRDQHDPNLVGYFSTPTPRGPNTTTGSGIAPEVMFSRDSGSFLVTAPFNLSLSTLSTNAAIFYAFGTNLPGSNASSFRYTNGVPIAVNNSLGVRARAFEPGKLPGPVTTKFYLALASQTNVINFRSPLPIIVLHNYGQGTVPASKADQFGFMEVFDNDLGYSSMTNKPNLTALVDFHVRGSSTAVASTSKSSFFVEVEDEFKNGRNVSLLGLPEESDWVFYAPNNFEPVLFHNPLAHAWYRDLGRYGSRTRFFELWLKDDSGAPGSIGAAEYNGVYVLEEKVKRNDNRVDIARLDPEDTTGSAVTGGYLLSIDRTPPGEGVVAVNYSFPNGGATINFISPNGFIMTNALRAPQTNYIARYLNAFNTDLNGINYTNIATTNHYSNYIDVDCWIDLHIHETITFNVDGMRLSGYFYKDRDKKLSYGPTWDYDRTQGSTDGRDINPRTWQSTTADLGTDFFNPQVTSPAVPWWGRLFTAPDFWQAWIDRYQQLRRPGNALDTNSLFGHIQEFVNELTEAQQREQAKWAISPRGAGGSGAGTYATEVQWERNWYSNRLDFADNQFLAMPVFNVTPGAVSNLTVITITPAAGLGDKPANTQLILTLDGTDPRVSGGSILTGPNVLSNTGPISITVSNAVRIFARSRNTNHVNLTGAHNPSISSPWSGTAVGTFYVSNALPALRITEIMYNPPNPPAGNTNDSDNFEYLEFKNVSATPLDVTGFRLRGGVEFDFPSLVLGAGQSCVVVADVGAFGSRYNTNGLIIAGSYTNNPGQNRLGNGGDHLTLQGRYREPILDFDYKDGWYPVTDGGGFSLQIADENLPPGAWGLKSSWRPSGQFNGSPGAIDPGVVAIATVYINEIVTHTDLSHFDQIELYNPNAFVVNIGGWFLTDNFSTPQKYRIPNGTTIGALGYVVFSADTSFGGAFNLSSKGEEVYLFSADANTNLTGFVHGFSFGAQASDVSFGRYVTSTGEEAFPAQSTPSFGAANAGPQVGPIVISAFNYHPPDFPSVEGPRNNEVDEFVELQNATGVDQPLFDPNFPTNTWHLRNALDYAFPTNVIIPPGGRVLIVSFDPADPFASSRFRAANQIAPTTPLFGPFQGHLDNDSDSIELARPDVPQPFNVPDANVVYYILADKVSYSASLPWPSVGLGAYLHRLSLTGYGNDPTNWVVPVVIATHPQSINVRLPDVGNPSTNIVLSVAASGTTPISYQWRFNGANIPGANGPTLSLNNITFDQTGDYSVVLNNSYSGTTSRVARVNVYTDFGWRFNTVTGNFGATSNGTGTNVLIYMQAAGEAYVDDITLVPLSGPLAGSNVLQNGGFESPVSTNFSTTNWIVPLSMSASVITNTYAHSGNYSLHVVATNGGSVVNAIRQLLPPSTTNILFTLSFWYHTLPNSTNLNVRTFPGSALAPNVSLTPVDVAPAIYSQPNSLTIHAGTNASFNVSAYGTEPFSYQWFKDGALLADGGKISGSSTATLTVSGAQATEGGNYSVKVINLISFVNSTVATLTVTGAPPQITLQPQSQSVACHGNVTLTVEANGSAPLSYQWLSNQVAIANATNTSLTLTNLGLSDGGPYSVVVSNPAGSTNSVDATITVTDALASLTVARSGTNLVVSWPRSCTTYQLEDNATLDTNGWHPVGVPAQGSETQWTTTIPIAEGNRFYRLRN